MARSQLKEAPKPLMIRGDRLLLAFEVIAFFYDRRRTERGLRSKRIKIALCRLFNLGPNGGHPLDSLYDEYQLVRGDTMLELFAHNAPRIANIEFDVAALIRTGPERARTLERFLRAIASGELTEEDFKEED